MHISSSTGQFSNPNSAKGISSSPTGTQSERSLPFSDMLLLSSSWASSSNSSRSMLEEAFFPFSDRTSSCPSRDQMQSIWSRWIKSRTGSNACRDRAASRYLQQEMLTSTSVALSMLANFLTPFSVTILHPCISNLDSLEHPRAMATRLASVKSKEFLIDKDFKPPHTATPSRCKAVALQTPWNWPSFSDVILGQLRFKASRAEPA